LNTHLALGPDLRRDDHRGQHIFELVVEIARDGGGQHPVEREAAAGEQQQDPPAAMKIIRRLSEPVVFCFA
jgi:hypothetical protein